MILTVTPNAAVDKTYRVEDFGLDRVHRPSVTHTVAGGKGINVARIYQTLGGQAVTTGFLGGFHGRIVSKALMQEGIADRFVRVRGESRLCIAIVDPIRRTQTEINERGPEVSSRAVRELLQRVETLLSQERFAFVVLSGSLPPGAPETLYADLIALARKAGVRSVLDASGAALQKGIEARPWMVKPNCVELEGAIGRSLSSQAEIGEVARALCVGGISVVVVTQGAEGALLVTEEGIWTARPPHIEFVSAVASGDSFAAAFLWAWQHGARPADPEAALRLATGAGAANAAVIGAGFCTRDSIFALAERAQVGKERG